MIMCLSKTYENYIEHHSIARRACALVRTHGQKRRGRVVQAARARERERGLKATHAKITLTQSRKIIRSMRMELYVRTGLVCVHKNTANAWPIWLCVRIVCFGWYVAAAVTIAVAVVDAAAAVFAAHTISYDNLTKTGHSR